VIYYADTSWWAAFKSESDLFHAAAIKLFERDDEAHVLWTPWQRVEVLNTLRQAERSGLVKAGKAGEIIRLLEQELRLGYWPQVGFNWEDAVRKASELSAAHASRITIRGTDLFHVAIALEVNADFLLTFDRDQAALAKAAGLPVYRWKRASK
jgi:predicted nucleic acid-binding protein